MPKRIFDNNKFRIREKRRNNMRAKRARDRYKWKKVLVHIRIRIFIPPRMTTHWKSAYYDGVCK